MFLSNDILENSDVLRRTTLHEETANRLRQMIYSGELIDGSKVPEKMLCDRFGISRTPLREALKVLANEGLIELLPNRGARISKLLPSDIDEVFPVMASLESLAGELAGKNITDIQLAEIRSYHYQMALHHSRYERSEYFSLNQKIHECIMIAAGNQALLQVYKGLSGRIGRARYIANIPQDRWNEAMKEHDEILLALERRDGPKLGILLKSHLMKKSETIKIAIQEIE